MITIQEVELIVNGFHYDLNEIKSHLNEQDEYINDVAKSAEKFANALRLLKFMTRNNLEKIEGQYYVDPVYKKVLTEDDDISKYYDPLLTDGIYHILILDKESPLCVKEVTVKVEHLFDNDDNGYEYRSPRIITFSVDGKETLYSNDNFETYGEGKYRFPPIHNTILQFIEDSKLKAKDVDDLRKITSVENNPIGKQD